MSLTGRSWRVSNQQEASAGRRCQRVGLQIQALVRAAVLDGRVQADGRNRRAARPSQPRARWRRSRASTRRAGLLFMERRQQREAASGQWRSLSLMQSWQLTCNVSMSSQRSGTRPARRSKACPLSLSLAVRVAPSTVRVAPYFAQVTHSPPQHAPHWKSRPLFRPRDSYSTPTRLPGPTLSCL